MQLTDYLENTESHLEEAEENLRSLIKDRAYLVEKRSLLHTELDEIENRLIKLNGSAFGRGLGSIEEAKKHQLILERMVELKKLPKVVFLDSADEKEPYWVLKVTDKRIYFTCVRGSKHIESKAKPYRVDIEKTVRNWEECQYQQGIKSST